jgi:hypothetical protein
MNKFKFAILAATFISISCEKSQRTNSEQAPPKIAVQVQNKTTTPPITQLKRLNPSAFPALPKDVQSFLLSGGYTIPQLAVENTPHNVISAPFFKANQVDWAVLASRAGESEILIFQNGSVQQIFRLARRNDDDIRNIQNATPTYIKEHHLSYGGSKLPEPLDHNGIDDGLDGKASMVWYFHNQQWLNLQGAD